MVLNILKKWSKTTTVKFNTAMYKESHLGFKRNLQMHKTIESKNARLAAKKDVKVTVTIN